MLIAEDLEGGCDLGRISRRDVQMELVKSHVSFLKVGWGKGEENNITYEY